MKNIFIDRLKLLGLIFWIALAFSEKAFTQSTNISSEQHSNAMLLVVNAPGINGRAFCSKSIVRVVNYLRSLGKSNALAVLKEYMQADGKDAGAPQNQKILLICRLLFQNPDGWERPRLGEAYPDVDQNARKKIPLFPLIISHGVPFLMINGYQIMGYTDDTADKCIELCQRLPIIKSDIQEYGYNDAANSLISSEEFGLFYVDTNVLVFVKGMILEQARCSGSLIRGLDNVNSAIEIRTWSIPNTNNSRLDALTNSTRGANEK